MFATLTKNIQDKLEYFTFTYISYANICSRQMWPDHK